MQVRAHYAWLLKNGKMRRDKDGKVTFQGPLSPKTVSNVHIVFRSALNDAVNAEGGRLQHLVSATTEAEAREAAARQAGSEGPNYWRDPSLTEAEALL